MKNSSENKFSQSTESEPPHTKFGQAAHQIEPERDLDYLLILLDDWMHNESIALNFVTMALT